MMSLKMVLKNLKKYSIEDRVVDNGKHYDGNDNRIEDDIVDNNCTTR